MPHPRIEKGMTLDVPQLTRLIKKMRKRYSGLAEKIQKRREHYHNLEAANPAMPDPYTKGDLYQTDFLRQTGVALKARIVENRFRIRKPPPKDTIPGRAKANRIEKVMNRGLQLAQERANMDIQGELSDGQIIECGAVLNWTPAAYLWPEVPEYEYADGLPEEEDHPGPPGFEKEPDKDGDNKGKHRETDAAFQDRRRHQVAKAGFPWLIQVVPFANVAFAEDHSLASGPAAGMIMRQVSPLDYGDELERDNIYLEVDKTQKELRIYGYDDKPPEWAPSAEDWEGPGVAGITVVQLWTRGEYYELVAPRQVPSVDGTAPGWKLVKAFRHYHGRVPLEICPAFQNKSADPVLRYEPALEGIYRYKPIYDRRRAMEDVIAESIALPVYVMKDDGGKMLSESGKPQLYSRNSMLSTMIPTGFHWEEMKPELNVAFVQSVQEMGREMREAAPATGRGDISATTQPWNAKIQMAINSLEPKMLMENQAKAIQAMVRNMLHVMSLPEDKGGFGEGVYVYSQEGASGRRNPQTLMGIEPEDIESLEVEVDIDPVSAAERVTLIQQGMEMLNHPDIPLTPYRFLQDYVGVDDPDEWIREDDKRILFSGAKSLLMKQIMAEKLGTIVSMDPDFNFVGVGGEQVAPEEVLRRNGQQPAPVAAGSNAGQMGTMGTLAPPGVVPETAGPAG